ncbi:MAG TPA: hypothetical protein VEH77_15150 [Roseiarcus sp.]|nr:hypothetical protein [Roseiarcus sp.]
MRSMLALALFLSFPIAGLAASLDDVLGQDAGDCVAMARVRPHVTHSETLSSTQFEFVRAFYMAIPPLSHELPIGDHAEIVTDGDVVGVVLIDSDSDQTCARFQITPWLLKAIKDVGRGRTVKASEAAGDGL